MCASTLVLDVGKYTGNCMLGGTDRGTTSHLMESGSQTTTQGVAPYQICDQEPFLSAQEQRPSGKGAVQCRCDQIPTLDEEHAYWEDFALQRA
jgi:hypothetical protein